MVRVKVEWYDGQRTDFECDVTDTAESIIVSSYQKRKQRDASFTPLQKRLSLWYSYRPSMLSPSDTAVDEYSSIAISG